MNKEKWLSKWMPCLMMVSIFLVGCYIRYFHRDFLSGDMAACLLAWYDEIALMDLKTALCSQVGNYNTLYQLMIFAMTRISIEPIYAYKILSEVFDLLLAVGGYCLIRRIQTEAQKDGTDMISKSSAMVAAALLWLSPIVWMNSAVWGQCDSMYVACIIWALFFLTDKKEMVAAFLIGVAFALKLQTVFIVPFLFLYLCSQSHKIKSFILCSVTAVGGFLACLLPNLIAGRPLLDSLSIYVQQTNEYHHMTMNYAGFWALFPDEYDKYKIAAIGLTVILLVSFCFFFFWKKYWIRTENMLLVAGVTSMICVLFLPSMHERYGFLYEVLFFLYACQKRKGYVRCGVLCLVTYRMYLWFLHSMSYDIKVAAVINLILFLLWMADLVADAMGRKNPIPCAEHFFELESSQIRDLECSQWKKLKAFDVCVMSISVIVYFLFCLVGIGKNAAPETTQTFSKADGQCEMVLSFEQPVQIQELDFFLGQEHTKKISISSYEDGEWIVLNGSAEIVSVFCWNKIEIDHMIQHLGIVFLDDVAYVNELVIKDADGQAVLPVSYEGYEAMFDEQELCPDVNTYYESTMFDEIYHGRTAYEFLHQLSIYENTHPPLGKTIISIGISLFGMNPFGWRIMCALCGSLIMPFFYLFAYRMSGKQSYGVLALVLGATEFMHFTLSRISTIDVIVALFVVAMFYYMYGFIQTQNRWYLLLCGLASGLAVATKWTGIYSLAGIAVIFFSWLVIQCRKTGLGKNQMPYYLKLAGICVICFILIPVGIYTLSYIPFARVYTDQNVVQHVFSNGQSMLDYHKNVTDAHPYSSKWFTWFVDYKPLVDARDNLRYGKVSVVATFGNPMLYLVGILAFFYELYLFCKKKNWISGGLLLAYLSMILPWVFVTRTVFIYQYFICTLILIPMVCHSMSTIQWKREKTVLGISMSLSTILFIMFYPVISGMAVSQDYIRHFLMWLPSWMFV